MFYSILRFVLHFLKTWLRPQRKEVLSNARASHAKLQTESGVPTACGKQVGERALPVLPKKALSESTLYGRAFILNTTLIFLSAGGWGLATRASRRREGVGACISPSPEITPPIQARQPNHYPDN